MAIRDNHTMAKILYALVAIFLFIGIAVFLNWARNTQTFVNATTHQPERLTELYFTDPTTLPLVTKAGQSLSVGFTINNLEAKDMVYTYRTTFVDAQGSGTELGQHQVALPNGKTVSLRDTITVPVTTGRSELNVQLIDMPEAIHFWVDVEK